MALPIPVKILAGVAGCALLAIVTAYLAALLYHFANRVMPDALAIDTWWRYWRVYGSDALQRPRLIGSGLAAMLIAGGAAAWLVGQVLARPRPLHGAARWATEREMRAAGLL